MLKTAKYIFQALLMVSLYIQSYLLMSLSFQGYWDIPSWMIKTFVYKHNSLDLEIQWDQVRLYPRKGLEITGLQFYSEHCLCPVIRIGMIRVTLPDRGLLLRKPLEGIIQNGVFYFPDQYLPEEDNLRLIDNLSFHFKVNRNEISLDSFRANISKLQLFSTNTVSIPFDDFRNHHDDEKVQSLNVDPREILDKMRTIRYIHQYFDDADKASIAFSFDYNKEEGFGCFFNLFSEGSRLLDNITTQNLYLYGELHYKDNLSFGDGIYGELESIRYGSTLRLDGLSFRSKHDATAVNPLLPEQITIHTKHAEYEGKEIDFVSTDIFPRNLDVGHLNLMLGVDNQAIVANADYDLEDGAFEIRFQGDFNPISIAKNGWAPHLSFLHLIDFGGTPSIQGSFEINKWKNFENFHFGIVAKDLMLKGSFFDYARGKGYYKNNTLFLDHFSVTQPGYTLRGSLAKSYQTTDYRYMLQGFGIPTDLNSMFKEWWSKTWDQFEFNNNPVYADIDIWGTDNDITCRHAYGKIALKDISYKGMPIVRGQVKLHALAKLTHLFDLDIVHAKGRASGEVMNIFKHDKKGLLTQHFDIHSNIPLHDIAPIVGDALDVYVENTNPEVAPHVWLRGCRVSDSFPLYKKLERLNIKIESQTPFEFFGIEIDSVDADVLKEDSDITVSPVKFHFANGQGSGSFHVRKEESCNVIDFKVDIQDFDYTVALTKIKKLDKSETDEENLDVSSLEKRSEKKVKDRSFMDLRVEGSCPLGDWAGLVGSGYVELNDPLIHRVHIFGGFSKMMDNAELNLGSFSLKKATSSIRLEGQKIFLDDLELTGPSSRVKSKGVINLEDQTLDFRLKAYPLREVKFPVVAGLALIFRPITGLFEVKVSGSLVDPEWKLVIDPSGL